MVKIDVNSALWQYLSEDLRGLFEDGEVLLRYTAESKNILSDYSFIVFPFAKGYEGFLKRLFLDLDIIQEDDYYGDEIRIGRLLNPKYIRNNKSRYLHTCLYKTEEGTLSYVLWEAWKLGRNQVFHYFPHNYRKLSYHEAEVIIDELLLAMQKATGDCKI